MSLRRGSAHTTYRTTDPHTGTARYFTGSPYNASPAYWLTEIDDRNGNGITYSRQSADAPATVSHDGGYQAQAVTGRGRIESLLPRTPSGPSPFWRTTATSEATRTPSPTPAACRSASPTTTPTASPRGPTRNGSTFRYVYDGAGCVVETIGPDGYMSSSFAYDAYDRVLAETDPLGRTTTVEYTHFDLPAARTAPDGVRHDFRHDSELRLTEVTNAQGLTWRYGYDSTGQLASETDFNGHTLAYAHDPASQGVAHGAAAAAGRPVTVCRPCVSGPVTRTAPAESTRPAAATAAQDPFRRRMDLGQGAVEPVRDPSGHAGQVVVAVDRPRRVGLRRARGADFR